MLAAGPADIWHKVAPVPICIEQWKKERKENLVDRFINWDENRLCQQLVEKPHWYKRRDSSRLQADIVNKHHHHQLGDSTSTILILSR